MRVYLKSYPAIELHEFFSIEIEPCIVNVFEAEGTGSNKLFDASKQYLDLIDVVNLGNPITYPQKLFAFRMFYPSSYHENQLDIPAFI